MSVLVETSLGHFTLDLLWQTAPRICKNFLLLCYMKYYNGTLLYHCEPDYRCYLGDPTGTGKGGESAYGKLYGPQAAFFSEAISLFAPSEMYSSGKGVYMRPDERGCVGSAFYLSLRNEKLDSVDDTRTEYPFAVVTEGFETLDAINASFVDDAYRPLVDIRIKHTYILVDPFNVADLCKDMVCESPKRVKPIEEVVPSRLSVEEAAAVTAEAGDVKAELEALEKIADQEAHNRAVMLEIIGDLPDADMAPPENVLFVCKLNPVTKSEDLEIIFSRFGEIKSCNIIRDWKTGDSLCYGFVEFDSREACERAYFKMNGVLVDDRRIRVDFSQSVARLWAQFRKNGTKQRREDNVGASEGRVVNTHANNGGRGGLQRGRPYQPRPPQHDRGFASRDHDHKREPRRSRSRDDDRDTAPSRREHRDASPRRHRDEDRHYSERRRGESRRHSRSRSADRHRHEERSDRYSSGGKRRRRSVSRSNERREHSRRRHRSRSPSSPRRR